MNASAKKKQKSNLGILFHLLGSYRRQLIYATIAVLLGTASTYLVPLITSFTLDYVLQGTAVPMPQFLSDFLDLLGGRQYLIKNLWICGIVLVVFTAFNGLFNYLRRSLIADVSEGVAKTLRDQLYRHLEEVPYDYHKHVNTGDLVQRCTSDVDTVRRFINVQMMEIVRTVAMVLVAVTVMFSVHIKMALISMALMPLLTISSFVYFRFVRKYFTASDEAEGRLSTMIQENLTGIRVVRAFGQQNAQAEKFTEFNRDYRDRTYRLSKLLGIYWGCSDAVGFLQIALSLFAGILYVSHGELTLGNVTMFTAYTGLLTWPVRQLGRVLADLGKASVSLGRIDEILSAAAETEPGKALTPDLMGDIVFDHVCFGYDRFDDVLQDICFTAKCGQTIGILGSTGSGKSSLVHLLQRLYPATAGSITINGTNINDIEHGHLRRNIAIVLQEPFLYSRTILENIRIVRPNASIEEVESAAKTASVHDVILEFEKGYDTLVGERGVTLSGGQRQRVAIARTLMQNAPILVFDDSMSAVDTETDAAIRDHLFALRHEGITFIISHRITTLCEADQILVLDDGRLVQHGTHSELLEHDGLYRRIAEIQDMYQEGGVSA